MVSLALQEAYMQDPLITIRVVIFASWWKKNVPVRSLLLWSHTLAPSLQPIEIVALIQELQILLWKGAVETASQSPGFYNSLFLIQKVSGVVAPHH